MPLPALLTDHAFTHGLVALVAGTIPQLFRHWLRGRRRAELQDDRRLERLEDDVRELRHALLDARTEPRQLLPQGEADAVPRHVEDEPTDPQGHR